MRSRNLIIKIFILLFLVVVLSGVFIWQGQDLGTGYTTWLKQAISKIDVFGMLARINPETKLSTGPVLDLFNIKTENLINNKELVEEDLNELKEEAVVKEMIDVLEKKEIIPDIIITNDEDLEEPIVLEPKLTLDEIKNQLDGISNELQEIEREIDNMLVLAEIQEQINNISEKITEISNEFQKLT